MIKIPTRVLLVDDEKDFVEMLGLRLEDAGEIVTPAHSGQECLRVLEKKEIDVVILDILMPGMDGIVTLKEIKNRFPLVEVIECFLQIEKSLIHIFFPAIFDGQLSRTDPGY